MEKHIRKNNLTVTFTDQLGQAKHSEHVTGEKEARKLAFYLFWNIKPYFTRCAILPTKAPVCLPYLIRSVSAAVATAKAIVLVDLAVVAIDRYAAVTITTHFLVWCRNHIIMEDLEAFLSPEQAREAFDLLDNNGDGKLVLADIRDAVIKIYKERRNLALSLKVPFLAAVFC